jgi:hypothetical protein
VKLYRFYLKEPSKTDPRPVIWPIKWPYWITGRGADFAKLVAYADSEEQIRKQWPDCEILDSEEVQCVEFSERFPRPKWWVDPWYIFVFGSNLAGRHGKGAAKEAYNKWGAKYGRGIGPQGRSYAIPTKDFHLEPLPLATISDYVQDFIEFARARPHMTFFVTKVGCGLAGYKNEQIAPMFKNAPVNCVIDDEWKKINGSH